jgi:hypothetical protein
VLNTDVIGDHDDRVQDQNAHDEASHSGESFQLLVNFGTEILPILIGYVSCFKVVYEDGRVSNVRLRRKTAPTTTQHTIHQRGHLLTNLDNGGFAKPKSFFHYDAVFCHGGSNLLKNRWLLDAVEDVWCAVAAPHKVLL